MTSSLEIYYILSLINMRYSYAFG